MKKRFILLLAMLLLAAPLFSACGETAPEVGSTDATNETQTESEPEIVFPLEEKYFNGRIITILCCSRHTYGELQFVPDEELRTNAINEAVIARNDLIEESYGITMRTVAEPFPVESLRLAVSAGLEDYDMICDTMMATMPVIPEGLFMPLDGYIDLNHAWWDPNATELLTLNDKHYLLSGDAILTDDDYTYLLLFNKDMYENNADLIAKYGSLYQLVRDGKWTFDVLEEMMREVSIPDENGAWTIDATYGMLGSVNIGNVFMNAAGLLPAEKTPDGGIRITMDRSVNVTTFDRVYTMFSNKQTTMFAERAGGFGAINEAFKAGKALFYSTNASNISTFKNDPEFTISFGVLPNPKLDEAQDKYYHTINSGNSSVIGVASTNNSNLEATCYLMELLGYYGASKSFKSVNEAYYETTLKLQAVESSEDAEMLDLIFKNRMYDIYTMMADWGSSPTLGQIYGVALQAETNTATSLLDSKKQSIELAIEETLAKFREME